MMTSGSILQSWRKKRRLSQLALALNAGLSSRHLSFIETNRATPSREMIFKIHQVLMLPRHVLNTLLSASGHLPHYKSLPKSDESLKPIFLALDTMLANHMPYPAFVLDKHWNLVCANEAMKNLLLALNLQGHKNMIDALTAPTFNQSFLLNYHDVLTQLLNRIQSEMSLIIDDEILHRLEKKLMNALPNNAMLDSQDTVLKTQFNIHNKLLSLFSVIAELGAVQEIAVGEFKIELMFPLDETTELFFSPPSSPITNG